MDENIKAVDRTNMNEMRRLMNLVESIERDGEILEEGIRDKILGAVAAAGIMMGANAQADTVFVYADESGQLTTVTEFMDVPDNAQMAYALDTETQKIKMIKSPGAEAAKPAPISGVAQQDMQRLINVVSQKFGVPADKIIFNNVQHITYEKGSRVIIGDINYGKEPGLATVGGLLPFVYTPTGMPKPARAWQFQKADTFRANHPGDFTISYSPTLALRPWFLDPVANSTKKRPLSEIWGDVTNIVNVDTK